MEKREAESGEAHPIFPARVEEVSAAFNHCTIDVREVAFDIDGVVADTMALFVTLARERFHLKFLTKDHLTCYDLHRCVPAARDVVDELICLTLDDEHTPLIPAMPGAVEVLTELARCGPLRFVTARIWPESMVAWLERNLPEVPPERIQVIATGDPDAKLGILQRMNVRYFLEDRLETCHVLAKDGIQPLLFDQPWNRQWSPFPRIVAWRQFRDLIALPHGREP